MGNHNKLQITHIHAMQRLVVCFPAGNIRRNKSEACLYRIPRNASAVSFIFPKTMEEISSDVNVFVSPSYSTYTFDLPPSALTTLKG
ncbi:Amyloid beta precursor like protein [Dirofilaria immitis]